MQSDLMLMSGDEAVALAARKARVELGTPDPGGTLIPPDLVDENTLCGKKGLSVALLDALSTFLDLPEKEWLAAIRGNLPEKLHAMNLNPFHKGREAAAGLHP